MKPYVIESSPRGKYINWASTGIKVIGFDEGNAVAFAVERGLVDSTRLIRAVEITWDKYNKEDWE